MSRWTIREEESYRRCVAQLGGDRLVDRAIETILDGLRLNPYGFPLAGYKDVRLARTRQARIEGRIIPPLNVRFRVIPPSTVSLLHIETPNPEEMEATDDWNW